MEMEIVVPEEVPVMTLPNLVFFPQALLPLHIFEPRYRQMLREVLASTRLFAVAGIDPGRVADDTEAFEPPHRVATVGIVRACQKNENGTSNLLIQGLCRVEFLGVVSEQPYRRMRIRTLASQPGNDPGDNDRLRTELTKLIALKRKFGATVPKEMADFLRTVKDPETFVDLAAFSLCDDSGVKQQVLEALDVRRRLQLFTAHLRREVADLRLHQQLQGRLPDDRITEN